MKPEQSKPLGVVPPQTYGVPTKPIAVETIARGLPNHPEIRRVLLVALEGHTENALRTALNRRSPNKPATK